MSLEGGVAAGVGVGVCADTLANKTRVTMQPKINGFTFCRITTRLPQQTENQKVTDPPENEVSTGSGSDRDWSASVLACIVLRGATGTVALQSLRPDRYRSRYLLHRHA